MHFAHSSMLYLQSLRVTVSWKATALGSMVRRLPCVPAPGTDCCLLCTSLSCSQDV